MKAMRCAALMDDGWIDLIRLFLSSLLLVPR
jgi:hypothetical protein